MAQVGSVIVCQRRKASSRHSSIQAGSPFFAEMKRDGVLVEALGRLHALDVGLEAVLVLVDVDPSDLIDRLLELLPSVSDPLSILLSVYATARSRRPAAMLAPGVQESRDVALRRARGPRLMRMARARDVGREPHRRQHVARPDLARRARRARAHRDAREIERDDQRLGAGARQAPGSSCWAGARRSAAMTTASGVIARTCASSRSRSARTRCIRARSRAGRLGRGAEPGDGRDVLGAGAAAPLLAAAGDEGRQGSRRRE